MDRQRHRAIVKRGYQSYQDYIHSSEWKEFRSRYFQVCHRKCRVCDAHNIIVLHHLTYDRVGQEEFGDVVPLCDRCHHLIHDRCTGKGHNWRALTALKREYKRLGEPGLNAMYQEMNHRHMTRRKRQIKGRPGRVMVRYECPRCGGPHPKVECDGN